MLQILLSSVERGRGSAAVLLTLTTMANIVKSRLKPCLECKKETAMKMSHVPNVI